MANRGERGAEGGGNEVGQLQDVIIDLQNRLANIETKANDSKTDKLTLSAAVGMLPLFFADGADAPLKLRNFLNTINNLTHGSVAMQNERCNLARAKLRGRAMDFLSTDEFLQTTNDWAAFRDKLVQRFDKPADTTLAMSELIAIRMKHGENLDDFAN